VNHHEDAINSKVFHQAFLVRTRKAVEHAGGNDVRATQAIA
jgi:hypothetical protein